MQLVHELKKWREAIVELSTMLQRKNEISRSILKRSEKMFDSKTHKLVCWENPTTVKVQLSWWY